MKKILLKQTAAVLALGALLGTTSAFAATETNATLNTSVKATADNLLNTTINVTSSSSVETGAQMEKATTTSTVTTNSSTRTSISLPINISLDTDLKNYENSIILKEDAVAKIDTTSSKDEITVEWKHEGKLFAFIPVTVTSETKVMANETAEAKVTTDMPWWSIFVSGVNDRSDEIDAKLEGSAAIKAYTDAKVSAQVRAQAVYEIVNELSADASLEAEANLKAQTN